MNLVTTQTNLGPTEILCRLNPKNEPIVVIARSYDGNQVQFWPGKGDELPFMAKHEYDRTVPLAKADEEVMAKRFEKQFKGTQPVVRHRLPRQERERQVLFAKGVTLVGGTLKDLNNPPASSNPSQEAQQSAGGNPAPAATQQASTPPATPFTGELPATDMTSAEILAKIKESRDSVSTFSQLVADLTQKLQQATTDQSNAQQAYSVLTAQYQAAIRREADDFQRKQQEALAAVLAPSGDPVADFAQQLQAAGAQPVQTPATAANAANAANDAAAQQTQPPAEQPKQEAPARGKGGKFVKGNNAAKGTSGKAKSIESQPGPAANPNDILKQFTPEQLETMAAAQRARQGVQPQK